MSTLERYRYYHEQTQHAGSAAVLVLAEQVQTLVGLLRNVDQAVQKIEGQEQPTGQVTVTTDGQVQTLRVPLNIQTYTQEA